MKASTGLLAIVLIASSSFSAAAEREIIPPTAAADRAGEKATVEFKVVAGTLLSDRESPICFLNSMKNFRSADNFTVVIFSEGLAKFKKVKIENPLEHFRDKTIRVTGVIGLRQGKPQIIVEYSEQIEIVDKKKTATE